MKTDEQKKDAGSLVSHSAGADNQPPELHGQRMEAPPVTRVELPPVRVRGFDKLFKKLGEVLR